MSLNCVVFLCIVECVSKFVYHVHVTQLVEHLSNVVGSFFLGELCFTTCHLLQMHITQQ